MVPGRALRAIFIMHITYYLFEFVLGSAANDYMRTKGTNDHDTWWTVARMTGIVTIDHARGFYATGKRWIMIDMTDFSQFDSSLFWDNARYPALEGMMEALSTKSVFAAASFEVKKKIVARDPETMKRLNLQLTWGQFVDYAEVIWILWYMIAPNTIFDIGNNTLRIVESEKSGELITLTNNSLVNWAFRETWRIQRPLLMGKWDRSLTEITSAVLGDDAITILNNNVQDPAAYRIYQKARSKVAVNSGLALTPDDVVIRKLWYEYLKNFILGGGLVPRFPVLQHFASEKGSGSGKLLDDVSSYLSFLILSISRGFDRINCSKLGLVTWMVRSFMREKITKSNVRLPLYLMSVPISLGGFGKIPTRLSGVNTDVATVLFAKKVPGMIREMDLAVDLMKTIRFDIRQDIADNIVASGVFKKGMQFIDDNIPVKKRKMALSSEEWLSERGIDIGRYALRHSAREQVRAAMRDSPNLTFADFSAKNVQIARAAKYIEPNTVPEHIKTEYEWLWWIDFEYTDYLGEVNPRSFVRSVGEDLKNLIKVTGHSRGRHTVVNPKQLLFKLYRDPSFPASTTAEAVLRILVKPGVWGNQEVQVNILLAMGVDQMIVTSIINELSNIESNMELFDETRDFSLADGIASYLDLGRDSMARISDIPVVSDVKNTERLLRDVAMVLYIMQDWWSLRRVKIVMTDESISRIGDIFSGKITGDLIRLMGIHPNLDVD
jgi:hypothetical protein